MATEPLTIEQHIIQQQSQHADATGELSSLLRNMALATKKISWKVRKAGLVDILGATGDQNVQGEEVQKLDEYANETVNDMLARTGHLCCLGSEEEEEIIPIPRQYECGKYILLHDPLDGSSNIDANVSVGTIFSILKKKDNRRKRGTLEDCLQPGYEQVAAGYVVYGSSTMFVYTTGEGVAGFTLDPSIGEFLLSHPDIKIPERAKYYSVNESYYQDWDDNVQQYVDYLKGSDNELGKPYGARYIGSFVADFHRNLLKGGIFMYPAKSSSPNGKLRLLYEGNPMAFIIEQAGGLASDGFKRILNIEPTDLHQRMPLIIGSADDVIEAEQFFQGIHPYQIDVIENVMV